MKEVFDKLENSIREYESKSSGAARAHAGEVDFDDTASIEETFKRANESLSTKGLLTYCCNLSSCEYWQ
jgi:hypothetical protein